MANSRSNIYPVQLQGAELNLNKYDAEIKQYSGFNKNNSPFVGGCLSNVFTKQTFSEGSDDNNTIIDTNGDVYIADEHLLYKNDKQILSYSEDKFFIQNELNFDDVVPVKIINENLYVVDEIGNDGYHYFYLKSKKGVFTVGGDETEKLYLTKYINNIANEVINIPDNSITAIFITIGEKVFCVAAGVACLFADSAYRNVNRVWCIDIDTQEAFGNNILQFAGASVNYELPVSICYDEITQQVSVFAHFIELSSGRPFPEVGWSFYTANWENKTLSALNWVNELDNSTLGTNEKFVSTFTQDYMCLNYPHNKVVAFKKTDSRTYSENTLTVYGELTSPYMSENNVYFRSKKSIGYKPKSLMNTGSMIGNEGAITYIPDGFFSSYLAAFDLQLPAASTNTETPSVYSVTHFNSEDVFSAYGFNFEDYVKSDNTTIKMYKWVLGDFVSLGTVFKLAVNNNQFSAICGENVLLTEWNSIDAKTLIFYADKRTSSKINNNYDERIYYKCNGKFYEIRLSNKPRLQKFENQIVVNVDSMFNSYDIVRNKQLHFACCFNSFKGELYNLGVSLTPSAITGYVGFAVNEYNQENNSSIILNPVNIIVDNFLSAIVKHPNSKDNINIYVNINGGSEIKYYKTITWFLTRTNVRVQKLWIDENLLNLPFPSDTNGNVEYNVNLFSKIKSIYGNYALISSGLNSYPLVVGNNNNILMNFYLASGVENLNEMFIIQGQAYGIIGENLYSINFNNGVIYNTQFIVNVSGLKFVGNTPYEVLFFSATNRCLYTFSGSNTLQQKQFVDKICEIRNYLYNPATQTVFLITDIGVLFYGLFGQFLLEYTNITNIFILNNGIVLSDNNGNYRYIKYYLDADDTDFIKENIRLETCFYGMNDQTVTINDCLYMRIFSEEHEEGSLKVSATTISLQGRKTEKTTFKIKASDWDAITHTIYLRYQPKEQRGLGVSFSIDSPFKIASLSVGSQADAILVDKVSKGAINAPQINSNDDEW